MQINIRVLVFAFLIVFVGAPSNAAVKSIVLISANSTLSPTALAALQSKLVGVFNFPIQLQEKAAPYQQTYNSSRGQYDSAALLQINNLFGEAYADKSFTFINDDIYADPYRYLLAQTSASSHRTIISTHRLKASLFSKLIGPQYAEKILVGRLYKILLRHIAFLNGIKSECGVTKFANNSSELDAMPDSYCDSDAAQLRGLGLLK